MKERYSVTELELLAVKARENVLRMIRASGHGHIGGAFSCIDIVTALYFAKMKVDPEKPAWPERDRFLLSAGHKCLAQYAVLAEKGFFSKDVLDTYGQFQTKIPGHPDMHKLSGIEANTGALGHGLAIAVGMALGLALDSKAAQVYAVLGDGELAEGSNWEAAAAAAKYGLDRITVFLDANGLQISGRTADVMDLEPIAEKFRAFGWAVKEIDGNNMSEIVHTLDKLPLEKRKPTLILSHTVKAKGLPFGEGKAAYHFWNASEEELEKAEEALEEKKTALMNREGRR